MSDKSLLVILGATFVHGTMPTYLEQLAAANIDHKVVDCSDKPNMNGGGNLGYRVKVFRKLAQDNQNYERLIISDAFDVRLYCANKQQVIDIIPMDGLLHAAEKNCYPAACSTLPIPDRGPHRYANGGIVAGTPSSFLAWCDEAERHPLYRPGILDQQFLNELVAEQSPLCVIDWKTELFFCLYGGYPELEFERGLPINTMYGTRPSFVHNNGKYSDAEMMAKYHRSLEVEQPMMANLGWTIERKDKQ